MVKSAMRFVVDTNIWLYAALNVQVAVAALDKAAKSEWAGYSAITKLEVFGFPDLKRNDERKLADMLGCFEEVPVSEDIIDRAIIIRRKRRIRVPDAIIAATATVKNAVLITNDTHFATAPTLIIQNC